LQIEPIQPEKRLWLEQRSNFAYGHPRIQIRLVQREKAPKVLAVLQRRNEKKPPRAPENGKKRVMIIRVNNQEPIANFTHWLWRNFQRPVSISGNRKIEP